MPEPVLKEKSTQAYCRQLGGNVTVPYQIMCASDSGTTFIGVK